MPSDSSDRIARIEAKVDDLVKWNRIIFILLIVVLVITALLFI